MKNGTKQNPQAQFEKLVADLSAPHATFYKQLYKEGELEKELEEFIQNTCLEDLILDKVASHYEYDYSFHILSSLLSASNYTMIQGELAAKLCNAVLEKHYANIDWNKMISVNPNFTSTLFQQLCYANEPLKEIIKKIIHDNKIDWNNNQIYSNSLENPMNLLLNSNSSIEYLKTILYSPQNNGSIHVDPNFVDNLFFDEKINYLAVQICLSHDPMPEFYNEELK